MAAPTGAGLLFLPKMGFPLHSPHYVQRLLKGEGLRKTGPNQYRPMGGVQ